MQPLMERNGRSHLLRTLRESCHIAQELVFNGSDVFWADTSGLYPAWVLTYDSELGSFNYQLEVGYLSTCLVLDWFISIMPRVCHNAVYIFQSLPDQYSASKLISTFGTLPFNLCILAPIGHPISCSSAPIPTPDPGPPDPLS
jgi:hypothetical protein